MRLIKGQNIKVGDTIECLGPNSAITVDKIDHYDGPMTEFGCIAIARSRPDSQGSRQGIALYQDTTLRVQ